MVSLVSFRLREGGSVIARLADLIAGGAMDYYITQYRLCVDAGKRTCRDDARQLVATRFSNATARNLTDLQNRADQSIYAGQQYRTRNDTFTYDFTRGADETQLLRNAGYRGQIEYRYTVTATFIATTRSGRIFQDRRVIEVRSFENLGNSEIMQRANTQMDKQIADWQGYGGRFAREILLAASDVPRIEAARKTLLI